MMPSMTELGLPIVDGAPACPFVAFGDDREARATGPDHRHRCFAEVRPAPRALAHQEAYCLSSAFPVCPTFQDWAKREAAAARATPDSDSPEPDPEAVHEFGSGISGPVEVAGTPSPPEGPKRNPPREWTSPPPWLGSSTKEAGEDDEDREVLPIAARGGGLAGSFADRVVNESGDNQPTAGPVSRHEAPGAGHPGGSPAPMRPDPADDDQPSHGADTRERPTVAGRTRSADRDRSPGRSAPAWERVRRREAYPTLKTRLGLNGLSVPPIMIGVAAVIIAAVALFTLPGLVGVGNPPQSLSAPSPSTSPSNAGPSATPAAPTPVPGPTAQIYLVQSGDTMSRIANRFGVPLQVLIDANKVTIPDPNKLDIGQEVTIPVIAPTLLPDAGASAAP